MKVLYIATYEGLSGASYSLLGMINELRKKGVNPLVILLKDGQLKTKLEENNIPYMIVHGYPWVVSKERKGKIKYKAYWLLKSIINMSADYKIAKVIKNNKIDLIHINALTAAVGFNAAQIKKIPCIWHIREFVEEDLQKEFWNKEKAMLYLAKADEAIAISESVKEKFQKQAPESKIEVIYNGVAVDDYLIRRKQEIFKNETVRLIISGRIDPGKGHFELIEAIKKIEEKGIVNIRLQIVGVSQSKQFDENIRKKVCDLNLQKYIEFLGYRNDLPQLYKESDIAIVASKSEAFGRVTVEAMMAGSLVIGANTAGTKELIGENYGLLYEQGNADDLAQKIIYAIQNKNEMRIITQNAYIHALEEFSATKNAENVYKEYECILKNRLKNEEKVVK